MGKGSAVTTISYMGREAILLENGVARAIIDRVGGMMPEFSARRGDGYLNAHYLPAFRANSGRPWSAAEHAEYWKVAVLYNLAGDFPCCPSFGAGGTIDGLEMPPHGWTANSTWDIEGLGVSETEGASWASFSLDSPAPSLPLSWRKSDILLEGQAAYYSVMRIANRGDKAVSVNLTRHNTLGSPFLQAGCRIHLAADRFQAAPEIGTEPGSRLVVGAEFDSLDKAPLKSGGTVDLGFVPGMVGATDFVAGAIPRSLALGWSCVVNPVLGLAYLSFFPGEPGLPAGEIALGFNDLWMQYGGRPTAPWALHEGGADTSFCLGAENGVGAYANGLEYSKAHPTVLGRDSLVTIPARGERKLCYGTALVALDEALVAQGIRAVEAEEGALVVKGAKAYQRVAMDARFARVRRIEESSAVKKA